MKTKMMIAFLLAFLFIIPGQAQEKLELNGDTVIVISPKDLQTINGIIVDWEWLKKEVALKDSLLLADSVLIEIKDSTIVGIEAREKKKEEWYIENGQKMAKENAKLKRQKKTNAFLGGGIGAIIGILIGLLL